MLNSANGGAADTAVAGARALFRQSNGERLTAEEIQRLVERADSDKLRRARERHLTSASWKGNGKKNPDRFRGFGFRKKSRGSR
jgi:hypothetical protein